jgi:hypothetical protein
LLDSENLTCHVQEFKVGYSTSFMIKSPPPPHTHTLYSWYYNAIGLECGSFRFLCWMKSRSYFFNPMTFD